VTLFAALVFLILGRRARRCCRVRTSSTGLRARAAIPLAIAVGAFSVARKRLPEKAFTELKAQLDADAQALRAIGARS
jgi:hypothetical protein